MLGKGWLGFSETLDDELEPDTLLGTSLLILDASTGLDNEVILESFGPFWYSSFEELQSG